MNHIKKEQIQRILVDLPLEQSIKVNIGDVNNNFLIQRKGIMFQLKDNVHEMVHETITLNKLVDKISSFNQPVKFENVERKKLNNQDNSLNTFEINSNTNNIKEELIGNINQIKSEQILVLQLGKLDNSIQCSISRLSNQDFEVRQNGIYLSSGTANKVSFDLLALGKGNITLIEKITNTNTLHKYELDNLTWIEQDPQTKLKDVIKKIPGLPKNYLTSEEYNRYITAYAINKNNLNVKYKDNEKISSINMETNHYLSSNTKNLMIECAASENNVIQFNKSNKYER